MPLEPLEQAVVDHALRRGFLSRERWERLRGSRGAGSVLPLLERTLDPAQLAELRTVYERARSGGARPGAEASTVVGEARGASASSPAAPRRIGPYVLEAELGRGGMGAVYRATHVELRRPVALKLLLGGSNASERARERFRLEAQAAARLRHRHVVAIHDVGETPEGDPYLALDLVPGESLGRLLEREGPLEPRRAAELVAKIARALDYAHELLILHRDVKPDNVLLDAAGEPLLTDFGLAKVLDGTRDGPTLTGQFMGTPGYAPPEQLQGAGVDRRADVYAAGATLYALLTGDAPFGGESMLEVLAQVAHEAPTPPSRARPDLPPDLETICLRCLEKEPGARYPTAAALADDLERFVRDEPIQARRPGPWERLGRWRRRNRALARGLGAAAALVAFVGLAAGAWVASERARARRAQVVDARRGAEAAWAAFEDGAGARTPTALQALVTAQRWRAAAPEDAAAAAAQHRAALALADVAVASEQWDLAAYACDQAAGLGVDDAGAARRKAAVTEARTAEATRRREAVEAWLTRAASGELARRSDGLDDAVFGIARYPGPATVSLLATRLEAVAADLLAAEAAALREVAPSPALEEALDRRRAVRPPAPAPAGSLRPLRHAAAALGGAAPPDPDAAPTVAPAVAAAQRERVGPGALDVARVCCEALGRIGVAEGAVPALAAYLHAEDDPIRATAAAKALARLPGEEARRVVHWGRRRFGLSSPLARQVDRLLAADRVRAAAPTPPAEGARLTPDQVAALVDRGLARAAEGDPAGAEADFSRALASVDDVAIRLNRGAVRTAQGDLAGAAADFRRAVALAPDDGRAWHNLAEALHRQGQVAEARRAAERAVAAGPERALAWVHRGELRAEAGDVEGALADFDRALELEPDHPDALARRGEARLGAGDLEAGLADLDRAVAVDPQHVPARIARAEARRRLGDSSRAHADLVRATEVAPGHAGAWNGLGTIRYHLGDMAGARRALDRALELGPELVDAWTNRGLVKAALGDPAGAEADHRRALELRPDAASALANLAQLRLGQLRPEEALGFADRAVRADPGLAPAWISRAQAKRQLGDLAGALADCERALQAARGPAVAATAFGARAMAHERGGDLRAALADLSRALELTPQDAELWARRGEVRGAAGDRDGALADCARALELHPRLALAFVVRGKVRLQSGDQAGALDDLERFLELEPDHPDAPRLRELLARTGR